MSDTGNPTDRLRRVNCGETWHGTGAAVREALDGIDGDTTAGSDPADQELSLGVTQHMTYHVGQIRLSVRQIAREEASS